MKTRRRGGGGGEEEGLTSVLETGIGPRGRGGIVFTRKVNERGELAP